MIATKIRIRRNNPIFFPTIGVEKSLLEKGFDLIAGIDEVGRGCLAGPVVAASVILCLDKFPEGINDSKKLPGSRRKELSIEIKKCALAFAYGFCSSQEIDAINILQATRLAMLRSVQALNKIPKVLLIDGRDTIDSPLAQKTVIHGDQISVSIAAASILAKVYRDEWMEKLDLQYPGYGFAGHKGYGSLAHRQAIQEKGPSPIHRKSFSWTPV